MDRHPPAPDTAAPEATVHERTGWTDTTEDDTLSGFLTEQDVPWLAEQLIRVAREDPVAHARLAAAAGLDDAAPLAEQSLREAVLALRPGALDWDIDGDDGSEQLLRCIDLLDDLTEYGYAEESAQIARRAADLLTETHPGLDDDTTEALAQRAASAEPDVPESD